MAMRPAADVMNAENELEQSVGANSGTVFSSPDDESVAQRIRVAAAQVAAVFSSS